MNKVEYLAFYKKTPICMVRNIVTCAIMKENMPEVAQEAIADVVDDARFTLDAFDVSLALQDLVSLDDPIWGFVTLQESGLLHYALPELDALRGVTQTPYHHCDAFVHTLLTVAAIPSDDLVLRWAALLHDIGKPATHEIDDLGDNHFLGHENVGADMARSVLERFGYDEPFIDDVCLLIKLHMRPHTYDENWSRKAVLRLVSEAGPLWEELLSLCQADHDSDIAAEYADGGRYSRLKQRASFLLAPDEQARAANKLDASPLRGEQIQHALNISQGPMVGALKRALAKLVQRGALGMGEQEKAVEIIKTMYELVQEQQYWG